MILMENMNVFVFVIMIQKQNHFCKNDCHIKVVMGKYDFGKPNY